jgi:predicted esterase
MRTVRQMVFCMFVFFAMCRGGSGVSVDDFIPLAYTNSSGQVLPYRLFVPQNYSPAGKYPLVLFLHGAGERGTDNRAQLAGQTSELVFVTPQNQSNWPCLMLAPQCPSDQLWVNMPWGDTSGTMPASPTWPMASTMTVLTNLFTRYSGIDTTRVCITGLSIGGFGTWDAIIRYPGKWLAAVPICGGGDSNTVAPIVHLPIWAFHAADDSVVPVVRSRTMISSIRALGGNPLYTEYPASLGYGHGSWVAAYAETNLLPWLFNLNLPVNNPAATSHGIPYPWLQSYGITNTNDSVETQRLAGSSLNVLQDYIAGLDPTNPNSCFLVGITNSAGQIIVRVPSVLATGPSYAGKARYYDVELRTNLLTGSWQPVPNHTNIPGNGSFIICTNASQDQAKFYRVKAWLQQQ